MLFTDETVPRFARAKLVMEELARDEDKDFIVAKVGPQPSHIAAAARPVALLITCAACPVARWTCPAASS